MGLGDFFKNKKDEKEKKKLLRPLTLGLSVLAVTH